MNDVAARSYSQKEKKEKWLHILVPLCYNDPEFEEHHFFILFHF